MQTGGHSHYYFQNSMSWRKRFLPIPLGSCFLFFIWWYFFLLSIKILIFFARFICSWLNSVRQYISCKEKSQLFVSWLTLRLVIGSLRRQFVHFISVSLALGHRLETVIPLNPTWVTSLRMRNRLISSAVNVRYSDTLPWRLCIRFCRDVKYTDQIKSLNQIGQVL